MPAGAGIFQADVQIRGRQARACLLGPFDQDDRPIVEQFVEPGFPPFMRIAKSIEIKVIEV